jgi:hypothetical protein
MMSSSLLFAVAIISFIMTATNAFTVPKTGTIHHRNTAASACLDGMIYDSSQPEPEVEYDPNEMIYLCLYHDNTNPQDDKYIFDCLVDIVHMSHGDAYDAIDQSKKIAKMAIIDEFPRDWAEYYYEQLTAKGISVIIEW